MFKLKNIPTKNNVKSAMTMEMIFNLENYINNNKCDAKPEIKKISNENIKTLCKSTNCYFVRYQNALFKSASIFVLPSYKNGVCEVCYKISRKEKCFSELRIMSDKSVHFL